MSIVVRMHHTGRRRTQEAAALSLRKDQPGAAAEVTERRHLHRTLRDRQIGPDLFRHACLMGLEGLVSKHRESIYRGGQSDRWIKVKNRQHPAFSRVWTGSKQGSVGRPTDAP
jgi:ATP-dependent DNA ligase